MPAAREIGARGNHASVRSRPVHTNAISRVSARNTFGAGGRCATGAERVQNQSPEGSIGLRLLILSAAVWRSQCRGRSHERGAWKN